MLCYFTGMSINKKDSKKVLFESSSPQTLGWKSSTQWNAIGGRHFHLTTRVFWGHFCIRWKIGKGRRRDGCFFYGTFDGWKMIWFSGICLLYLSERVSVEPVDSVLKYLNCCVSGWRWSMLYHPLDWFDWLAKMICAIHCCVLVIDDYKPLKLT